MERVIAWYYCNSDTDNHHIIDNEHKNDNHNFDDNEKKKIISYILKINDSQWIIIIDTLCRSKI